MSSPVTTSKMIGALPQNTIVKSFDSHFKTSSSKKIFRSLYGIVNFFIRSISPVLSLLPTQFIHHDRTHARTHATHDLSYSPLRPQIIFYRLEFTVEPYEAQTFSHFSYNQVIIAQQLFTQSHRKVLYQREIAQNHV